MIDSNEEDDVQDNCKRKRSSVNIENFILPKNIINIISQEDSNIEQIKNHIEGQK